MKRNIQVTPLGVIIIDELTELDKEVLQVFDREQGNVMASTAYLVQNDRPQQGN